MSKKQCNSSGCYSLGLKLLLFWGVPHVWKGAEVAAGQSQRTGVGALCDITKGCIVEESVSSCHCYDGSWKEEQSCWEACEGLRSDHQAEAFRGISSLQSASAKNLILLKTSGSDFSSRRDAANPQHVSRTHMCGRSSLHGAGTLARRLPSQHSTTSSGAPVRLGCKLWRHEARFGTLGTTTPGGFVSDESPCFDSGGICFQ